MEYVQQSSGVSKEATCGKGPGNIVMSVSELILENEY